MRILIAIDGSPQSTYAVQAVGHFRSCEEVILVHALALPDLDHPMITPELRDRVLSEVRDELTKKGEAWLDQAMGLLPQDIGPIHRIHEIGHPSEVILETAQAGHADLVVLGARGLGPVQELLLGSVSHRVLLHAPCSTWVIRTPLQTLQHVLIPVEGEEDASRIFGVLTKLPFRTRPKVTVMTVWPQPQLPWPITFQQSRLLEERALEHAQNMIDTLARRLQDHHFTTATVVGLGDPAFAILEQARASKPDLLLVGSHGRKGLTRFLLGSVSHTLVHHAPCPVLVVRDRLSQQRSRH
ncbi:MAG: universal stress protein [Nitrospirae bacterium]|nr:MAG: universal stress protein [Nitrospirota bacterium]